MHAHAPVAGLYQISATKPGYARQDSRPYMALQLNAGRSPLSYANAPLAWVAKLANPAGSFTARSARILRSSSIPAFFNP